MRILGLIAGIAVVFLCATGVARWRELDAFERREVVVDDVARARSAVRLAQVRFKIQVQEWKNVLIRGSKPQDFKKYWGQFVGEETRVRDASVAARDAVDGHPELAALADEFLTQHQKMGRAYRRGAAVRKGGDITVVPQADALVRGIDRAPTTLLDQLVEAVEQWGDETLAASQARLDAELTLIGWGQILAVAASLLASALLLNRWVTRRISHLDALATEIRGGRLEGEEVLDPSQDDLGRLQRNLYAMRTALFNDRMQIQRHSERMRGLLDNIPTGFLMVDQDHRVLGGFTKSVSGLVERPCTEGLLLGELIAPDDASKQAELSLGLEQLWDDVLPEELSAAQVPSRFETISGRYLRIAVRTVRSSKGEVTKLLVTIADITDLQEAERAARRATTLLDMVRRKSQFRSMLRAALSDLEDTASWSEHQRRRILHTVKGNAGLFGLDEIATLAHQLEDASPLPEDAEAQLRSSLTRFVDDHADVLGFDADGVAEATLDIRAVHLDSLQLALQAGDNVVGRVEEWVDDRRRKPVARLLGPLEGQVARLAERLNKQCKLYVFGGDMVVDPQRLEPVLSVLPHLLRNAVDHGIEPSWGRTDKPGVGRVELSFSETEDAWCIRVGDDGRGVDTEAVRRRLVERKLVDADVAATLDDSELYQWLMSDGFTTLDTATEISGRGVGMAAVTAQLTAVGGALRIHSVPGEGTTFEMSIPRSAGRLAPRRDRSAPTEAPDSAAASHPS